MRYLKLYPVVFEYDNEDSDEDPKPFKVVTNFTNKQWKKLTQETFDVLIQDQKWTGIKPTEVVKSSEGLFLEIIYHFDQEIFNSSVLPEVKSKGHLSLLSDILNMSIESGGYPVIMFKTEKGYTNLIFMNLDKYKTIYV